MQLFRPQSVPFEALEHMVSLRHVGPSASVSTNELQGSDHIRLHLQEPYLFHQLQRQVPTATQRTGAGGTVVT